MKDSLRAYTQLEKNFNYNKNVSEQIYQQRKWTKEARPKNIKKMISMKVEHKAGQDKTRRNLSDLSYNREMMSYWHASKIELVASQEQWWAIASSY